MARPEPKVIKTIETLDGSTWDITHADNQYVITYQGQPCGVRHHYYSLTKSCFKYQKLSYTNLGNAEAQVRRLNKKFNSTDFSVVKVT